MRFRAELVKGTTPSLVLALLAERPMHGYELARAIQERSAGALALGQGVLYPTLHRLEREGLIVGSWEARRAGPERRVYRITPKGQAVLADGRAEWAAFADVVGRFLGQQQPMQAPSA
ncbi:MAG TPA: helix-turn-helix transcriptional regulator [Chloroflexota bacterium]